MAVSERPARASRSGEAGGRYLTRNTTVFCSGQIFGIYYPQKICTFGYVLLNTKYFGTSLEANRYRLEEIGITS